MTNHDEKKCVGKHHSLCDQSPEKQGDKEVPEQPPGKPDFDRKDQNTSPQRKAPGPGKGSRTEPQTEPESAGEPQDDAPAPPEAVIDDGSTNRKGKKP